MSLKNKLRFSALAGVLAAPVIALPLVNAVKSGTESTDIPSNLAERKIMIGENSFYTVKFSSNGKWGMHATINRIYVAFEETIDKLELPRYVEAEDGKQYEVKDIEGGKSKDLGAGEIKCLDLSQCKGLEVIHDFAFYQLHGLKIRAVNFKGCSSLKEIGESAFERQWLHNDYMNAIDLSGTQLTTIGERAFMSCACDDHNVFDAIVFPPTLKKIGKNAFSTGNESTRIRFKKVIFTDPNPNNDLFTDGIPRVADTNGKDIIVPYGSLNKYRDLKHFDRTYAKNLYDSKILYYNNDIKTRGSLRITTPVGTAGVDQHDWYPVNDKKVKQTNSYLWLVNPNEYDISLDEQGHLHWGSNLPVGQHNVRVCAVKYDDELGKELSFVISDLITISVVKPILTGGTEHIVVQPGAGTGTPVQDVAPWKVDFEPAGKPSPVSTVKWTMPYITGTIAQHVELVTEQPKNEAIIQWKEVPDKPGTYSFILCAEVEDKWAENSYKVYKQVYFSIGAYGGMAVQYKASGMSDYAAYNGQEIKLEKTGSVDFKLTQPTLPAGATQQAPQLSIEGITPSPKDNDYVFTFNAANFASGLYQITAHSFVKDTAENQFDIYSTHDMRISVDQQDTTMISETPNEIDVIKTRSGSYSYKLLKETGWKIDNVVANPSKWHFYDRRIDQQISFEVDPNDNKSIVATWSNAYSPSLDAPYDDLDVMLDITISNPTTNESKLVHQSVSVLATNTSEVAYEGPTTMINVCPGEEITSDKFTFKLNGAVSGYNNAVWKCITADSTLQGCISMNPDIRSDTSNLIVDLSTSAGKALATGVYDVTVYAEDDADLTASFITIQLNVNYIVSILDAPTKIQTIAGNSGKSEKPLITKLGQKVATDVTYKIDGLGDRVFVDDEGYVNWKGNIPAGSYNLCLTASVKLSGKTYQTSVFFTIDVLQPAKSNTGAIIGGSVGGAVAAGGGATGITLGVRKHKLPKGKKK